MYTQFVGPKIFLHPVITIACFCVLAGMSACKKDKQQGSTQTPVTIAAINPSSGSFNTVVTITGTGFAANASGDSVKFNGVGAVVQQASATQLTVVVPKAAGTGPVKVQVGNQSGTGPVFNFNYTYTVSTLAGGGGPGFADGNGGAAKFQHPDGIASDAQGNIYVADVSNQRIRKITPAGVVTTFSGSGIAGYLDGRYYSAKFNGPKGLTIDPQGNFFVSDLLNNRIRKITPEGNVSTFAGSGDLGFADGAGVSAKFRFPHGITIDTYGNLYVADNENYRIRKITPASVVSTLAGSGTAGFADGNGAAAQFNQSNGVVADALGNIYIADGDNHRIRRITPNGMVSTWAGSSSGFADGNGIVAKFNRPNGISFDPLGNLYIADSQNQRIRRISPDGEVITIAGNGTIGNADGNGPDARFYNPSGIICDHKGNIYVTDGGNNSIRLITVE